MQLPMIDNEVFTVPEAKVRSRRVSIEWSGLASQQEYRDTLLALVRPEFHELIDRSVPSDNGREMMSEFYLCCQPYSSPDCKTYGCYVTVNNMAEFAAICFDYADGCFA